MPCDGVLCLFCREGEVEVVPGRPSLYRTMLRVVWKELLLSALLRMVVLLWEFSQPLLLQCVQIVNSTVTFPLLPRASAGWGKVIFSVCVSVHTGRYLPWIRSRGTYLGWGEGYLPSMGGGGTYLGKGVGVPTLDGGEGVPTLDRGRGTYLEWGRGYLP